MFDTSQPLISQIVKKVTRPIDAVTEEGRPTADTREAVAREQTC